MTGFTPPAGPGNCPRCEAASPQDAVQIAIIVRDSQSGAIVPCWIWIENAQGSVIQDNGTKQLPGFPSNGDMSLQLAPGDYRIRIHHGSEFEWIDQALRVPAGEREMRREFGLQRRVDLRKLGWFCGDIHNHPHGLTPAELIKYLRARGVDYLSICQGWLVPNSSSKAHDGEALAKHLAGANTDDARIEFGAEYPKTRYGHVCWFSIPPLPDPHGLYYDFHDLIYFEELSKIPDKLDHPSRRLPFRGECNFNKILRLKKKGGVTMSPHPTSWWTDIKDQKNITTNISADFILGLFAGKLYDTLAVMGYDAEHIFYQNFWFNLLNRGHKIAGVAETDGNTRGPHSIGHLRCYSQTGSERFDLKEYLAAVKSGNTFMTSGPLLFVTGDNGVPPGGSMPIGSPHTLKVEAHADAKPGEYLSWLVLYRNGKVMDLVDFESSKPRRISHVFELPPDAERAWYIVKVYGSTRPPKREYADIMQFAALCGREVHGEYTQVKQVAFTNPFYVEPADYREPAEIRPRIRGSVRCAKTGKPLHATVRVLNGGELLQSTTTGAAGSFDVVAPISCEIEVESPGHIAATVNIPVHYGPVADLIDEIIAGRWALDGEACWKPGQVPFEVFQYERLHRMLTTGLDWTIELKPA